ncbi:preprotein translocase subunit SecG [Phyllobacterium leguminum]|uniref:preprotein translocase subunit SecG n=1 Tax=Phyllobacterium leguminum TaxID=314237 RepID=UPI000DA14729|nr:preprotein translocase subunit SecG [Phyllobacterium leguminum]
MQPIIIVIHLLIVIALVGVVLIQRSEGGGLGIGGGSGFMTARGAANALTRTTAILAAAFFATSIILGVMAHRGGGAGDILDRIPAAVPGSQTTPATPGSGGVLNQLGGASSQSAAPAPAQPAPSQANPATPADPVPNSQ